MRRVIRPLLVMMSAVLAGAVLLPAPALAHGKVTIQPAQAGAADALVTVNVDAESATAGAVSVRVVLPDGIAPTDVTYVTGPTGWALKAETDGYTVSGPALAVGREAKHQVRVRKLPPVPQVAFKVVQTYSDGQVDRWIEVPTAANREPANPAPVVNLGPPPGGFPPSAPAAASAAPSVSAVPSAAAAPSSAAPSSAPSGLATTPTAGSGGTPVWPWVLLVVVLVAAAAVGTFLIIRRRAAGSD